MGKIFVVLVGKVGKGQEKSNHEAIRLCGCLVFSLDECSLPLLR